jgi:hypothetical protein
MAEEDCFHFIAARKQREREREREKEREREREEGELGSQYLLQGHIPKGLTSFHQALPPKGPTG